MGKKNRKFSADFKARVALEAIRGNQTISQITSQYKVGPTQVSNWKKQAIESIPNGFKSGIKTDDRQAEIDELYKEIGKLQVENAFLKKTVYRDGM